MGYKIDLINYRIKRAGETLEEAELALNNNKLSLAENRAYYAIFYIVSVLSLKHNFSTSKHSPLKGWFNQTFVKTKKIEVKFGKTYAKAYEKRQKADYDDFVIFHREEVKLDIENAAKFVLEVKQFILSDSNESETEQHSS